MKRGRVVGSREELPEEEEVLELARGQRSRSSDPIPPRLDDELDLEPDRFSFRADDSVLKLCLTGISDKAACDHLRRAMESGNTRLADELVTGRKMRVHLAEVLAVEVSPVLPVLP